MARQPGQEGALEGISSSYGIDHRSRQLIAWAVHGSCMGPRNRSMASLGEDGQSNTMPFSPFSQDHLGGRLRMKQAKVLVAGFDQIRQLQGFV